MSFKRPFNKIRRINRKAEDDIEQSTPAPISTQPPQPQKITNEIKLSLKPQLFPKREAKLTDQNEKRTEVNPTPRLIKRRVLDGKTKENVVMKGAEEDNREQNLNLQQQSTIKEEPIKEQLRRPNLKVKKQLKVQDQLQGSQKYQPVIYERMQTEYMPSKHVLLGPQEVSFKTETLSLASIEKQNKRAKQLAKLVNLQIDLYEQTLSIRSITQYESYVNRLKSAVVRNAGVQSFDEVSMAQTQTSQYSYHEFTQQCPQDYVDQRTVGLQSYIRSIAPVLEQLLRPPSTVSSPPIFLLALKPVFKAFLKCPNPVIVYHSSLLNIDVITLNEKMYAVDGEVSAVLCLGATMIAGLSDGRLAMWSGVVAKKNALYNKILNVTESTHFATPSYLANDSPSIHKIVAVLQGSNNEIVSVDERGIMVEWKVQGNGLIVGKRTDLARVAQREYIIITQVKKRQDKYYLSTSSGIMCWDGTAMQLYDEEAVYSLEVPKRYPLIYALTSNAHLRIYHQSYSQPLSDICLPQNIIEVILPQIHHQHKFLPVLSTLYLIGNRGELFQLHLATHNIKTICEPHQDKNMIYSGAWRNDNTIQIIHILNSLQCRNSVHQLTVSIKGDTNNIKKTIEENKAISNALQNNAILIA